jgi:16S rRNA (guanine966-N2)-methyltransferase
VKPSSRHYRTKSQDATVLDLFAGSGALGIEALSRGAKAAYFVDSGNEAYRTILANLAT